MDESDKNQLEKLKKRHDEYKTLLKFCEEHKFNHRDMEKDHEKIIHEHFDLLINRYTHWIMNNQIQIFELLLKDLEKNNG